MIEKTLEYYNQNADSFVANTLNVDFQETQQHFLGKLENGSYILDFGCGSGRDTKYFMDLGYRVDAMDGSAKLCQLASDYTGIPVKHMLFQDLKEENTYDAIWACSSILHLKKDALKDVLKKMALALKNDGIIYTSFKYGEFEGERNGRYFTDFTLEHFEKFINDVNDLAIEEHWITGDVRPGRGDERWLNLILRKNKRFS